MRLFKNVGNVAAAVLGRRFDLTLSDGTQLPVRAIWDPARRETAVGDYGAVVESFDMQLHIARQSFLTHGLHPDALDRSQVTVDGTQYELVGPRDDGKSVIKLSAREL